MEEQTDIYVCGNSQYGQLGVGEKLSGKNVTVPKICSYKLIITKLSCGGHHTVFITSQGHVYSMGNNEYGQLGIGRSESSHIEVPTLIESLLESHIQSVKTGCNHTMAMTVNNEFYSWGQGYFGALGTGLRNNIYSPRKIKVPDDRIVKFSCGDRHSGFITEYGRLYMMGSNESGQCGIKGLVEFLVPTLVSFGNALDGCQFMKLACGYSHSVVIVRLRNEEERVLSFGCNQLGQLGAGREVQGGCQPREVNLKNVRKIKASNFSSAITDFDELYIWGCTLLGEFDTPVQVNHPRSVSIVDVSLGASFGCALDINGNICTWGKNNSGELALGDDQPRNQLTLVNSLKRKQIKNVQCGSNFIICIGGQRSPKKNKEPIDRRRVPRGILKKKYSDEQVQQQSSNEAEQIDQSIDISDQRSIKIPYNNINKVKFTTERGNYPIERQNQSLDCENQELKKDKKNQNELFLQIQIYEQKFSQIEKKLESLEDENIEKSSEVRHLDEQNQLLAARINELLLQLQQSDTVKAEQENLIKKLEIILNDFQSQLKSKEDELAYNMKFIDNCNIRLEQKQVQNDKQQSIIDDFYQKLQETTVEKHQFDKLQEQCKQLQLKLDSQMRVESSKKQRHSSNEKNPFFENSQNVQNSATNHQPENLLQYFSGLQQRSYSRSKSQERARLLEQQIDKQKSLIDNSSKKYRDSHRQ